MRKKIDEQAVQKKLKKERKAKKKQKLTGVSSVIYFFKGIFE